MAKKHSKPAKPATPAKGLSPPDVTMLQIQLDLIGNEIDECDSLISVTAAALRHQDADNDGACADVIEYAAWAALERAREHLKQAVLLLPSKEVADA